MDVFERIPVDVRWKLAAREFSGLPPAYRRAIRDGADDLLYNEIERAVWQVQSRNVGVIARAFWMPTGGDTGALRSRVPVRGPGIPVR
ncbi:MULTISPECIES: hypothetical protein [unclassified Methanoculleus]|uniref:hypothetical protein n=1 Tax=unclassified Methanoculleus TaxID=2619537 RepID=UPI0025DA509E|nr:MULTISPECIES: hypothetical protein [unclassified Methanoculleus]MCK9318041.1 hypothetical protein [Methanoculleus sp.]MDD2253227.1 hypothetical protein [Methanoculleus sp.]MDD2786570.1 hypothetical protein [Methanoculleus sp.]MDD3215535.1 hypothetical protein [Methanoculleus sp.]MDD4313191.1 hypothetical protein [Methanoculleus sp.]